MLVLEVPEEQVPVAGGVDFDVSVFFFRLESVGGRCWEIRCLCREKGEYTPSVHLYQRSFRLSGKGPHEVLCSTD